MNMAALPVIIQGGMGVGVSDWKLARAVSSTGQLGVVSGSAVDAIMTRRLQTGDAGGHVRRALARFPIPDVARRILDRYFIPAGKPADQAFKSKPMPSERPSKEADALLVASNYVEVFLAKEGHAFPVGINFLEKIQVPTLASIYGAMLAGVSCILMGAGIPRAIPGIIDRLADGQPVELKLDVQGASPGKEWSAHFDPSAFWQKPAPKLPRPAFFAIVSSATLAQVLAKKASGRVDGFIIEGPTAGGHNAPPRGELHLSPQGEPIYGQRDAVDLGAIRALGLPFWLAGSYAHPERVAEALSLGAAGVQVGTAFAFCEESGIDPSIKKQVLDASRSGAARVFTDPRASPTGFPFKTLQLPGTMGCDPHRPRDRICDLGYLRHAYQTPDGTLGWRCPAEPTQDFVAKGGSPEDAQGRVCICNGLLATVGLGQVRGTRDRELPLITCGDDIASVVRFARPGSDSYSASDVIRSLLAGIPANHGATPVAAC